MKLLLGVNLCVKSDYSNNQPNQTNVRILSPLEAFLANTHWFWELKLFCSPQSQLRWILLLFPISKLYHINSLNLQFVFDCQMCSFLLLPLYIHVRVDELVTNWRYLRFFPNFNSVWFVGKVLGLENETAINLGEKFSY